MQQELKAGKGVRLAVNGATASFIAAAMDDIQKAWSAANTESEFWDMLDWPNTAEDAQYGERKWVAIQSRGEEFRVAVTRNKKGVLSFDFRLWWA
jgi:hypothetical protein